MKKILLFGAMMFTAAVSQAQLFTSDSTLFWSMNKDTDEWTPETIDRKFLVRFYDTDSIKISTTKGIINLSVLEVKPFSVDQKVYSSGHIFVCRNKKDFKPVTVMIKNPIDAGSYYHWVTLDFSETADMAFTLYMYKN